jgi:asparaginyl-tRNA synthetase
MLLRKLKKFVKSINSKALIHKKIIISSMESNIRSDQEHLQKLLKEMNIDEKSMPEVPKKETRVSSFGGRIRIASLVSSDADKWIDKIVIIGGWARTLRLQGGGSLIFLELNDGSSNKGLQIVVNKGISNFEDIAKEGIGSCFQIKGLVVKSPGNKQPIEILISDNAAHSVKVVGTCNQGEYKLIKSKENNKMKIESLRDICHLRPRTNIISCVTRIRNNLSYATHQFFQMRGFLYIHTPIITSADCEGIGEMFQVTTVLPKPHEKLKVPTNEDGTVDYKQDFFGKPTFLTVSGQLAVENFACALSDVYTFGPTFRAENSHTSRHLAEFWMIEPEMCFADIFDDMECAENYLKFCLKYVIENNLEDLEFLDKNVEVGLIDRLKHVAESDFKRLSYTEAIEILKEAVQKDKKLFAEDKKKLKKEKKEKKKEGEKTEEPKAEPVKEEKKEDKRNIYWGMDMASEHERYLTEEVFKIPVIVYNYPKEIKSFYMRQNDDGKTVAAMDMLVPKIGEIIGGSQREERLELIEARIKEIGMDPSLYWWYLELRKYGSVPHAGFGLGFERLVMMATGLENIRDVIPYPRYPGHSDF